MRFVSFIIIFFLSFNSFSEVIKTIKVEGNSIVSRGTILNYTPYEVGDDFDIKDSNKIINELFKTGYFRDIQVIFDKDQLVIKLQENPVIKFVDFKNYEDDKVLSEDVINKIKANFTLDVGKIYNEKNLKSLLNQLKSLYVSKGYFNAIISSAIEVDSLNRIGIEINFKENKPALIDVFDISGNKFFSSEELLEQFDIGEPDFFIINYFTERDKFDEDILKAGIEKIKNQYLENGYLDFRIVDISTSLSQNKEKISIKILLEEGNQFKIGKITFDNDFSEFKHSVLQNLLGVSEGEIFNRKKILKGIKKIQNLFSNKGYANSQVESPLTLQPNSSTLDLSVKITKGQLVYINRIEISGNTRTQDDVIRRELKIIEGQIYSKKDIDKSLNRIKRLGFFDDVKMTIEPVANNSDKVNLKYSVSETKTGEFTIGLSHSNSSGAAVNAGIKQNNILGTGNVFNGQFTNSSAVEEVRFYFSDPHFNKDGHTINYGAFTKTTDASNLDVSNYVIDETGLNFGYGIPIDSNSKILAETRISNVDVVCGSTFASSGYEPVQCSSNDSFDHNLGVRYLHNSLNDSFAPTKGKKTTLELAFGTPLGDFNYSTLKSVSTIYTPILEDSTLKFKSNLLLGKGYAGDELPFFKRYYGGGSSSVRGFDFNSLGAKYPDGKAKGGESSILLSMAAITPAKSIGLDNENIRVSLFTDAGTIDEKLSDFDLTNIRASTGVAGSWLTPIGPIGLHYALPLIKKAGDKTTPLSFELGASF